jgi:hypothetical protein
MDLKKTYAKLSSEHKLPEFEEMDRLFEISSLEKEDFLLREIRRRIAEKLEHYIKMLEGIINPETTLSGMHECKYFNDNEKTELFDLYRKLMYYIRECDSLSLSSKDEEEAQYIMKLYGDWENLEKKLRKILVKLKDSWVDEDVSKKDIIGYFG